MTDKVELKTIHTASCGLFGIQDDYIETYQSLDERFVKNKSSTFFFETTGDSMEPLIFPGDVLVVDRSLLPIHGKTIIAYLDGAFLCKRFMKTSKGVTLRSENKQHQDILVTEEMDFLMWGVVVAVARDMRDF